MNIKLGSKVKCIVTGFVGIATAKIEYLNGCVQYCVQPSLDKDGKRQDAIYLDWQQLKVIGAGIEIDGSGTGGPSSTAPTRYQA